MRLPTFADPGDARLARTVAVTFLSGAAIVALYFGRDVLIPVAVAVLLGVRAQSRRDLAAERTAAVPLGDARGGGRDDRLRHTGGPGHDAARRGRRQLGKLPDQPAPEDRGCAAASRRRRTAQPVLGDDGVARPGPVIRSRSRPADGARAKRRFQPIDCCGLRGAACASAAVDRHRHRFWLCSSCSTAII